MSETKASGTDVDCVRCGLTAPAATGVFYAGELGDQIRAEICTNCWAEWKQNEVMVINELKLNFMDPKSQDILAEQARVFLQLNGG